MTPAQSADFEHSYRGRRVLVTGHTGFTGGWISSWLLDLHAEVTGLSLAPNTDPSLFEVLGLGQRLNSRIGTIHDREIVARVFDEAKPEIVFHLAAQPIVAVGFSDPIDTFMTNVMGTVHILEEARHCDATRAVVCITTDKVYANRESERGYREVDELGAKDPYGASKACAELVAASYRHSMAQRGNNVAIATARGGNIVGGGDWADARIIPDIVRSIAAGKPLALRNPSSTRPWQHVLALAHGYLQLGSHLLESPAETKGEWNFGPAVSGAKPVGALVEEFAKHWKVPGIENVDGAFPEARFLHLDCSRARTELDWNPAWEFEATIAKTADWYRTYYETPDRIVAVTQEQIDEYRAALRTPA